MHESDFAAAQAFLLGAKNYWTTTIYRALRDIYDDLTTGVGLSPEKATARLQEDTLYRYFAWLERHLQRMKYTSRYGLIPYHAERQDELVRQCGFSLKDEYSPALDPDLKLPKYYRSVDIHQHQGGLWSQLTAGIAYEYGARTTTPLLGETHENLHQRFTDRVADGADFSRILDLGCGFGKSTRPFLIRFPKARVDAVDLSGPCLLVGAHFARGAKRRNVRYSQQDARKTSFENATYDLVTSTMLLHELPVQSLHQLFAECYRLLQPGGRMAHLDFHILPDEFRKLMHYGHSMRNNEPFMPGIVEMDLVEVLGGLGFSDIRIEQFKESGDVDLEANDAWRFPWTVISAVKPE